MHTHLKDEIHLHQPTEDHNGESILIYFICGNPGLIEYYRETLTLLFKHICASSPTLDVHVYGSSLPGFRLYTPASQDEGPYTLDQIIASTEENLFQQVDKIKTASNHSPQRPVRVILIGHSIGAYIVMEILRHSHESVFDTSPLDYNLTAAICLFPTIVHIAASPRGLWIAPLIRHTIFSAMLSTLAHFLLLFWPSVMLIGLIQRILGMSSDAANVTAAYLKHGKMINQTLYLAEQEMSQVQHDKWTLDIWDPASATPSNSNPPHTKLFFYWAANDYWVNNAHRDKLIAIRAATVNHPNRAEMEIDTRKIPHAFCIHHSKFVAERMAKFLAQIL